MLQRPKAALDATETQWTTAGLVINATEPSGGGGSTNTGRTVGIAVGVAAAVVLACVLLTYSACCLVQSPLLAGGSRT